ncbi:YraN family protein [Corynebacterium tapiri]|uniref:UPF0102 protein FHE74_02775 n=1 Tax=Corynebacterium tapiri TaxID=1448266 RepID=A0A5C4U6A9_9CORY|nr:YraN family protein [Corynebacterium tapiri]TNL99297.1 YraN family protein [Corynebacterium tapiri]
MKDLATRGEDAAAELYEQVVARNVRYPCGEIDIVARDHDGTVVFVEVKTRSGRGFGGAEAVTARKLARMRRAAARYLAENPANSVRFDVVELIARGSGFELTRYVGVENGAG